MLRSLLNVKQALRQEFPQHDAFNSQGSQGVSVDATAATLRPQRSRDLIRPPSRIGDESFRIGRVACD